MHVPKVTAPAPLAVAMQAPGPGGGLRGNRRVQWEAVDVRGGLYFCFEEQ